MSEEPLEELQSAAPIPYAKQCIDEADIDAVVRVLKSDFVTQGPEVERFENALCEQTGAKYAVAVSSGTAALHLACLSLDIGESDTGVVPANTFVATANSLKYCGAEVAFCDVDKDSGRAGETHFREAIERTEKPKVFLPVSYSGCADGLDRVKALADECGAKVIEDAAHSIGATYVAADGFGYRSGSCAHSDLAILSFHPVKHVCAGEGGAVLTNDEALSKRIRRLRSHGIEKTDAVMEGEGPWAYEQLELGMHYRMTDIQAALGLSQLKKLPGYLERRRSIAARYRRFISGGSFAAEIQLPEGGDQDAWHLYVVRFKNREIRRHVYDWMHRKGIRVQVHYRPVYLNLFYEKEGEECEGAEAFYDRALSLPLYPTLKSDEQDRVIAELEAALRDLA